MAKERQITFTSHGHILTNINVWSPDSKRLVYDVRSSPDGSVFDGSRIETVDVETGIVQILYQAPEGAHCGVATYHPHENRVIFIHGPENPTDDWSYGPSRRRGVVVEEARPGIATNLDACDLVPPFTRGALRGGSHVHVFSPDGKRVSFTYEDQVLARFSEEDAAHEMNLRGVGVSLPSHPVHVLPKHPRNHSGSAFTVLATELTTNPVPGSDQIRKAVEEGWIGTNGYLRLDGSRQRYAFAFQGEVIDPTGRPMYELFIVDLPDDLTRLGDGPLEGTATTRPRPPKGTHQRRLTRTSDRKYPGLQGPRHWVRSSPDGSTIAFLIRDDAGIVQLWQISPNGGDPKAITSNEHDVSSAFSWSPNGKTIAHTMDGSVCITEVKSGVTHRLTIADNNKAALRPEACVFSPDGKKIAYLRTMITAGKAWNQIFVCELLS